MNTMTRRALLVFVLAVIVGSISYLELNAPKKITLSPEQTQEAAQANDQLDKTVQAAVGDNTARQAERAKKAQQYPMAKELVDPKGYVNVDKISVNDLIGKKVILLDFWTYSCINCQRTTPYLNAWYEKYHDQGLEIIGVHTPEFDFEKNLDNVAAAVKKMGIKYPVVLDSDYGTWQAYGNRYWPRKYLIDIDGFVVYDHIGEGGYQETEKKIQDLLNERNKVLGLSGIVNNSLTQETPTPDLAKNLSPETYFGSARNLSLANGQVGVPGDQKFTAPSSVKQDKLYLGGEWNFVPEYAETKAKDASITFRYAAGEVYIVASSAKPVHAKVFVDGKQINADMAGDDVDKTTGTVTIQQDRLYKLIKDPEGYNTHTLQLIFDTPGADVYTFTFG